MLDIFHINLYWCSRGCCSKSLWFSLECLPKGSGPNFLFWVKYVYVIYNYNHLQRFCGHIKGDIKVKSAKANVKHCRFWVICALVFVGLMLLLYFYLLTSVFVGVHVAFVFLSFDVFICVCCVWLPFIRGIVSGDWEPCIVLLPTPSPGQLPPSAFVFVFLYVHLCLCLCLYL